MIALLWPLRRPSTSSPVIGTDVKTRYPELAEDLDTIDRQVAESFGNLDHDALRRQSTYRRLRTLLILSSALLSGLGGLQAVFPHTHWPGIVLLILGVAVTTLTLIAEDDDSLQTYYDARMKAERLRTVAFNYLAQTETFRAEDRVAQLRTAVAQIEAGKEPT